MKAFASLTLAGSALLLSLPASAQFQTPEDAVKHRKENLSAMGRQFQRLGAMSSGRAPFDAKAAQESAAAIESLGKLPWAGFGPETEAVGGTKARPAIWRENAKFKQAADAFMAESVKLNAAAKTGDLDQIKAAFGATAASCKACHDSFRN